MNGVYIAKSGYSWIWKLKTLEKFKLLIWLACHEAVPILALLHHLNMAASATCSRCGEDNETLMHCLHDCRFSTNIWINLGFSAQEFFSKGIAHIWIKNNAAATRSSLFLAGLWWTWRHRNSMCLNQETRPLHHINY